MPKEPQEHNVNIGYKRQNKPRHIVWKVLSLGMAAALLATVVNAHMPGEGPTAFAVLWAIFIIALVGGIKHPQGK